MSINNKRDCTQTTTKTTTRKRSGEDVEEESEKQRNQLNFTLNNLKI